MVFFDTHLSSPFVCNNLINTVDSSVPLTHHDPKAVGLICHVKKRKICLRVLSDLRIQSWIFLKNCTLSLCTYDRSAMYINRALCTFDITVVFDLFRLTSYSVTRSLLKMLIPLGQAVTIVTTLLPFADSLVYRTASYSESHTNQFLEIHEGE